MLKGFLWAVILAVVVGGSLSFYQSGEKYTSTIEVREPVHDEVLSNAEVTIYPHYKLKYGENISGEGRYIYILNFYSMGITITKAKGYDTKYSIVILRPNEINTIYLNKVTKKVTPKKESTPTKKEVKVKLF